MTLFESRLPNRGSYWLYSIPRLTADAAGHTQHTGESIRWKYLPESASLKLHFDQIFTISKGIVTSVNSAFYTLPSIRFQFPFGYI